MPPERHAGPPSKCYSITLCRSASSTRITTGTEILPASVAADSQWRAPIREELGIENRMIDMWQRRRCPFLSVCVRPRRAALARGRTARVHGPAGCAYSGRRVGSFTTSERRLGGLGKKPPGERPNTGKQAQFPLLPGADRNLAAYEGRIPGLPAICPRRGVSWGTVA